jgi:proteasome accessory factor B
VGRDGRRRISLHLVSAQRTERLLNLVICLLASRRFVTREQIRTAVPQYAQCESDEAFERMFERDKEDLREMGVPLVTGTDDAWFDDEQGYRIPRESYALPEITFAPDELAALGLAARAWQQATLAQAASQALRKLEVGGGDVDRDALAVVEPRVAAAEPAFDPLYRAVRDRRPVAFAYRRGGDQPARPRAVEPWGIVSWRGRWYLVGHDTDRDATRVFRLSRIDGPVRLTGRAGSVDVPADLDLRHEVAMFAPTDATLLAIVDVRDAAATPLRRRAVSSEPIPGPGPDGGKGWTRLHVRTGDAETLAAEVCGYGADVVAVSPDELRDAVVRRLEGVVAAGGSS